jgi:hypothetical protein
MVWVSGLVSAGLGVGGGILQSRNQRKLKARREPFLKGADQLGQAYLSDQNALIGQKQQALNRGFGRANKKLARSGYAAKRQAVIGQQRALGSAQQRGIDTGLLHSSIFQGARRGITADTSALIANITQSVAAMRADLDLQKSAGDAGIIGERQQLSGQARDLGMQSAERWLLHQTGAGFGQMPQAQGADLSGLGNVASYLFKGAGGDSKSLFDWLF